MEKLRRLMSMRKQCLLFSLCFSVLFFQEPMVGGFAKAGTSPPFRLFRVTTEQELNFGRIALAGNGGRVRITPNGERDLIGVENLGGQYGAAQIELRGRPHRRFIIINPRVARVRHRRRGHLLIRKIVNSASPVGQFDQHGRARLRFGGDLLIPRSAREGRYRGRVTFWLLELNTGVGL
ncbi:MAG: DUF4402 domain-containing protein [Pseudomonadota bacterium]